jgi:integration host factor subunit beta|tara:strand:- start:190 stop:483 length:294 start_codon:yes stop_codon:yes gene_type:complete
VNKKNKDTFKRSDIEESLIKKFPNISKSDILLSIDTIFNTIVECVALDEKVEIRGFGTFSKKLIRPRKFINPKTKKISYLGETSTLHFKPSKTLIKK